MTVQQNAPELALPEALVRSLGVIGLRWNGDLLLIGVPNNLEELEREALVQKVRGEVSFPVDFVSMEPDVLGEIVDLAHRKMPDLAASLTRVDASVGEGPVAEIVSSVISHAIALRASDIHFEPGDKDFVIRVRVDGRLEDLAHFPVAAAGAIVSRLKVLAQMNIVERRRPQDGQFTFDLDGKAIDVRVATIATIYGEKAVARLLDTRRNLDDVAGLGMRGSDMDAYQRLIHSQYGLIAVVGPTGAGKTTTLHSAIKELNTGDRNVVTIEDPVEYVVEGVNHVPVVESIGAGFAVQLRGLLRQDPDILLVGEMRDEETARIGIQAALAGRLVLTSFHATDSVAAIYRLLQMGIEPHLIAASLRGVIAQRLLRRICVYCKVEYDATAEERVLLHRFTDEARIRVARGDGCAACRGTGFRDRIGVFQILEIPDDLRELISMRPTPNALYAAAEQAGLKTINEKAYRVALEGETTVAEAAQLVGSDV